MCLIFHDWSNWEQYHREGTITFSWGRAAGKTAEYSEDRQRRKCKKCGKVQDETI